MAKIHFRSFDEDWQEMLFSQLYQKNNERNDKKEFSYKQTLSVASMTFNEAGNGAADASLATYKILRKGDIAFEGHKSKEFAYGRFVGNNGADGIMSPRFTALRPIMKQDSTFWSYYIHLEQVMKPALIRSTKLGTMMNELDLDDFLNESIKVPPLAEQQKIGNLMQTLDQRIDAGGKKLKKLKEVKAAMLAKMFPKQGQRVPEIRFVGHTGEWEQHKLFDCIEKIIDFRGRTPRKLGMDWSNEGYLALSALNVKDGYVDLSQDVHYGDQELYDKWMTGNELHKGQVLFTTEAPMGNVAQVPDDKGYILSQRTIAFLVKSDVIIEDFLAVVLRSSEVRNALLTLQSGATAKGVSQKSLSVVTIKFPMDKEEQNKIAQVFKKFDCLISSYERKLDKLQHVKQALLGRMFCD
ncbi:restriction endonuclease subunit S [Mitsuokella jalaludinii]|uniref:restriction endonuclease subunit S n=1 Tax=Mitsuokella jalaludinii TaxID=187979 RepID=UPI003F9904BF